VRIAVPLCILCSLLWPPAEATAAESYQYYVSGDPADVSPPTSGLLVLQGGGTDVDENYVRMGRFGGGGDFVVLRASGADEYNEYIYALCHCNSVETLVFDSRDAATAEFVIRTIRNAEALFIAGGDQSRYVRFWQGTPVQDAIDFVARKPAPVGGTSAGMAILGEFVYSAMSEASLTAEHALGDPYHEDLTLARDFLSLPTLGNLITDQHLQERDRIGRTVALLARLLADGWTQDARAIAADRETALHIDPRSGIGTVYATADHDTPYVYFMRALSKPTRCEPGQALTFADVEVQRMAPGETFNVRDWHGDGGVSYTLASIDGVLESSRGSPYGPPRGAPVQGVAAPR